MEQHIRAARAQELGLVRMLGDDGRREAQLMATALRDLPQQRRPSEVVVPGLLDGPTNVKRLANYWLKNGSRRLDRQSCVSGKSVSVRVDRGGRCTQKKQNKK